MNFSDITFATHDVTRLLHFYESLFSVKGEGDTVHASICADGLTLVFDCVQSVCMSEPFSYLTGHPGSNTVLSFKVNDVDETYERLKDLGIKAIGAPFTHHWGARSFQVKDPDGNILNFRAIPRTK